MPPSLNERFLSGIIKSSSNSIFSPKPVHSGHAPNGLLNEKSRGCISGNETPQSGHALFCEKKCSLSAAFSPGRLRATTKIPFALFSAVSTESAKRRRTSAPMTMRSITNSIVCFFCLSSLIGSSSEAMTPSMRARTKPAAFASSIIFWCSPFFPRITGAKI